MRLRELWRAELQCSVTTTSNLHLHHTILKKRDCTCRSDSLAQTSGVTGRFFTTRSGAHLYWIMYLESCHPSWLCYFLSFISKDILSLQLKIVICELFCRSNLQKRILAGMTLERLGKGHRYIPVLCGFLSQWHSPQSYTWHDLQSGVEQKSNK